MEKFKQTDTHLTVNLGDRVDKFRILPKLPWGYVLWNIGRQNFPFKGYIPLVKPTCEANRVNINDLCAVHVSDKFSNWLMRTAPRVYSQDIKDLYNEFLNT